jgi:predicted DNA-binding transcriptional regulator YafY
MAVLDGHHDAADPADPVGSALGKIMRALPAPVAAQAEAVRRTTAPVPDRSAARPDPGTTATLVEACSSQRKVLLDYRSEAGSEWSVEVEPWAVVVRHGRWYLLCRSCRADAQRAYRIDRVRAVELLDEPFTRPPGLDPVVALEDHLASGWEYETEVVIEAPLAEVSRCVPRMLGRLAAIDERSTRLTGSTSNPTGYAEGLALVPASFRILRGPELREAARELGRRMLDATAD